MYQRFRGEVSRFFHRIMELTNGRYDEKEEEEETECAADDSKAALPRFHFCLEIELKREREFPCVFCEPTDDVILELLLSLCRGVFVSLFSRTKQIS